MNRNKEGYSRIYPCEDEDTQNKYEDLLVSIKDNWNNVTLRKKPSTNLKDDKSKKILDSKKKDSNNNIKVENNNINKVEENKPKPELKSIVDRLYYNRLSKRQQQLYNKNIIDENDMNDNKKTPTSVIDLNLD